MAKAKKSPTKEGKGPQNPTDAGAFRKWLADKPHEWSVVTAARAALRVVPLVRTAKEAVVLPMFRATAIARFAAKYPKRTTKAAADIAAYDAYRVHATLAGTNRPLYVAFSAARATVAGAGDISSADAAADAISDAARAADDVRAAIYGSVRHDAQQLYDRALTAERLADSQLWPISAPLIFADEWSNLKRQLHALGRHWIVWFDWYDNAVLHQPHIELTEAQDAAFTDVDGDYPWMDKLRWEKGAEAVNTEIARRLEMLRPDPAPVQGVPSPIAISRRPDGRIGADAGVLATPTIPSSVSPQEHARALSACRSRAEQLGRAASSPQFNGRKDYGEALAAYLEWLPTEANLGNILLADGEARVLTKLFTADQAILATGFATGLSVLLEDHIGLRAFYPEVERHYHAVRTGRIAAPLSLDAIEGIRKAIHANTPSVFHESVAPAMDETGKPFPDAKPLPIEEAPAVEPGQPRPPKDPIADVDPARSRSFTFASAANRIWELLRQGKDIPQAREGWLKTYGDIKQHIGPVLSWLKDFWPGS